MIARILLVVTGCSRLASQAASVRAAEVGEVKIAQQFGIGYLPLTIMQHESWSRSTCKAAGLADTKVPGRARHPASR